LGGILLVFLRHFGHLLGCWYNNPFERNYEESESGLGVIETLLLGLDEYHRMVMEDEGQGRGV